MFKTGLDNQDRMGVAMRYSMQGGRWDGIFKAALEWGDDKNRVDVLS